MSRFMATHLRVHSRRGDGSAQTQRAASADACAGQRSDGEGGRGRRAKNVRCSRGERSSFSHSPL
eukprot:1213224-Pleurochrysis_carterae.AAC.4